MVVLDTLQDYNLLRGTESHENQIYDILEPVVVFRDVHKGVLEAQQRKLINNIKFAISEEECFVVVKESTVIGVALLTNVSYMNFIVHIKLDPFIGRGIPILILSNYIFNTHFKDEDVYVTNNHSHESFKGVVEPYREWFKIKKNAIDKITNLYNKLEEK